jgi:membrane-bound metal-dependent hydrolase YbcI (DUF457 family)
MFIGHFAVALGAKAAARRTSLGALTAAVLLPDLLWPIFLVAGWEQVRIAPGATLFTPLDFISYPYSHSLAAVIGWACLLAILYYARAGYGIGAVMIAAGVVSHWVLDAITHRPDMPLYPGGGPRVGLALWNSFAGTLSVEGAMFAAGVWIYRSATRPLDRAGSYGFAAYVLVLILMYVENALGPPPPDPRTLSIVGFGVWLFPAWAWWIDRHRTTGLSTGPE